MDGRKPTNKILIGLVILISIISLVGGVVWIRNKAKPLGNDNKPGSGKTASVAVKKSAEQQSQKQQAQSQALAKQLATTPKDPKSQCIVTVKFNAEQTRNDMLEAENKRHNDAVSKKGNTNAENYIHKQNLASIQKQFEHSNKNTGCK